MSVATVLGRVPCIPKDKAWPLYSPSVNTMIVRETLSRLLAISYLLAA